MYSEDKVFNYDKRPLKKMDSYQGHAWKGYESIVKTVQSGIDKNKVLIIDMYHGTDEDELIENLIHPLKPDCIYCCEQAKIPEDQLYPYIKRNVTDDRVFGSLSTHTMEDFYDSVKVAAMRKEIDRSNGFRIVYGVGAAYVYPQGEIIYCDLTRWEIQLRYRAGLDNWGVKNYGDDILRKVKRGYFLEWRVQDRHKMDIFDKIKYYIDTNREKDPSMIDQTLLEAALDQFVSQPFRLIPYFDEGIWGGRWMEAVCQLERKDNNYAWCFDGVPEENSIGIAVGDIEVEMPAMNLVKRKPRKLLGEKVFSRFGAEFPIRFDFLDTMGGGNLSLQVHPNTEYIQQHFGMHYTQDESYYVLDAGDDAAVYLGVKEGISENELVPALKRAETGEALFDDTKYINCFPIKKHDHIMIPAGTIHCSGKNAMILEISATPYIFTMKLWDWGRVGLDGKPRPINVDRGAVNICYDRTTDWCKANLLSPTKKIQEEEGLVVERTGLHELEFVETIRYWTDKKVKIDCSQSVNMLNLVEGKAALVTGDFEPMVIHYAETFILPANVKEYCIEPYGNGKNEKIGIIRASVKV